MGTRSITLVKSGDTTKVLYRHYDSYPVDHLNDLGVAIVEGLDLVHHLQSVGCKIDPIALDQGDLEYSYSVDLDKQTIDLYGGKSGTMADHMAKGKLDPFSEGYKFEPDYWMEYEGTIESILIDLTNVGWLFNGDSFLGQRGLASWKE